MASSWVRDEVRDRVHESSGSCHVEIIERSSSANRHTETIQSESKAESGLAAISRCSYCCTTVSTTHPYTEQVNKQRLMKLDTYVYGQHENGCPAWDPSLNNLMILNFLVQLWVRVGDVSGVPSGANVQQKRLSSTIFL